MSILFKRKGVRRLWLLGNKSTRQIIDPPCGGAVLVLGESQDLTIHFRHEIALNVQKTWNERPGTKLVNRFAGAFGFVDHHNRNLRRLHAVVWGRQWQDCFSSRRRGYRRNVPVANEFPLRVEIAED